MTKRKLYKKFINIYDAHVSEIFRYCFYKLSNKEGAEDLTQESFSRLWKSFEKGKNIENARAFLYRVAGNLVVDFYRKKKSVSLDQLMEKGFDKGNSYKNEIEIKIDALTAMKKLERISKDYGEAVFLRYVNGLNTKEIAAIMGKSEGNVSVCIHRGIKKLKDMKNKIV